MAKFLRATLYMIGLILSALTTVTFVEVWGFLVGFSLSAVSIVLLATGVEHLESFIKEK